MYLINVNTQKLVDTEKLKGVLSVPQYAILSHKWGSQELSYREILEGTSRQSEEGYYKLRGACSQAKKDGLDYLWIDTCCINKESSAELSEAINSMYKWYRDAEICYAYLGDISRDGYNTLCRNYIAVDGEQMRVDDATPSEKPTISEEPIVEHSPPFTESVWFTRAWTLQELIAPKRLSFYDSSWNYIGTRENLCHLISGITRIPPSVLRSPYVSISKREKKLLFAGDIPKHDPSDGRKFTKWSLVKRAIDRYSLAQRMSWAAGRKCARDEDRAYSLLGLLGINMPLLYGEGSAAFRRLQEEVIKRSTDDSILAWTGAGDGEYHRCKVFATSPDDFGTACARIVRCDEQNPRPFEMTNAGLNIKIPLCRYLKGSVYFGILRCRFQDDYDGRLALVMSGDRNLAGLPFSTIRDDEAGFYEDLEVGDRPRIASVYKKFYNEEMCTPVTLTDTVNRQRVKRLIDGKKSIAIPQIHPTCTKFQVHDCFPESWNLQTGVVMLPTLASGLKEGEKSWGCVLLSDHSTKLKFIVAFGFHAGRENRILHMLVSYQENESIESVQNRLFEGKDKRIPTELQLDANRSVFVTAEMRELENDKVFVIDVEIKNSSSPDKREATTPVIQDRSRWELTGHYILRNSVLRTTGYFSDFDP